MRFCSFDFVAIWVCLKLLLLPFNFPSCFNLSQPQNSDAAIDTQTWNNIVAAFCAEVNAFGEPKLNVCFDLMHDYKGLSTNDVSI